MSHRKFIKSILWTALFAASAALAQEAAISGADFTGGKADAQLGAIGKQAAASGKTVVITAPAYWQAKAAARVRAGAHGKPLTIRFSNGFYENVLVRVEAPAPKPETEAKPETAKTVAKPKPQTKPEQKMVKAEIAQRPVSKPVAAAPNHSSAAPAPRAAVPSASPQPAKRLAVPPSPPAPPPSRIVAVPQVSHQPQVVPIPTSAANPTGVKSELPGAPAATGDAARQRLLSALNDGRPAAGELREAQLQSGDQLYSDGGTLAVVRLEGLRRSFYWLTGPVDLQRAQYSPQGSGRYLVTGSVNPKAPPTHRSETRRVVDARVPAAHDTTRAALERQYNNGQPVTTSLHVRELQPEDRLLIDGKTILVVRREGNLMTRYWLEGSIDLDQSGVRKTDQNLYEVTGSVH
ncbi:MAG TPA: hypothetical protein VJ727_00995 [Rhodanobacteraceae bacterium]|nr:hypothetical protein [Rhodanobacteraceae bacterium]